MKSASSLVFLLPLAFLSLSACDKQETKAASAPAKPEKKAEVDPTETSQGVLERLTSNDTKGTHYINRIQEFDSAVGTSPIKVTPAGREYLFFDKYGRDTLRLGWKGREGAHPQAVLLQMDSSQTRMYIPLDSSQTSGKSGTLKVPLHPDSSLLPGIFEVEARIQDDQGRTTKPVHRWVIVGGRQVDMKAGLPGTWRLTRHTGLGSYRHKGHFVRFDGEGRSGEWMDFKLETNPVVRQGWLYSNLFEGRTALEPNWKYRYLTEGDNVRFIDHGIKAAGYRVLALSGTKLVIRENAGGGVRFGVFERWPRTGAKAKAEKPKSQASPQSLQTPTQSHLKPVGRDEI